MSFFQLVQLLCIRLYAQSANVIISMCVHTTLGRHH